MGRGGQRWPQLPPSACCPPALQHHCTVPTYSCAVTSLAIHPVTNNLVIAYSDQQVGALWVTALVALVPSPRLSPWPLGFSGCHRLAGGLQLTARLEQGLPVRWHGGDAGEDQTSRAALSPLSSCSSSASPRSSTRPGAAWCRTAGCTRSGWRGTHPSPTSPSTPRTPHTSCSTTPTCSASSTSPW